MRWRRFDPPAFPDLTGTPGELSKELRDLGINCEVITLQPGESH